VECAVDHLYGGTNANYMVADSEGGLYIANYGGVYGGRVGADGCVVFLDPIFFGAVDGLAISPQTGLLYVGQHYSGVGVYRLTEPGRVEPVGYIDLGDFTNLDVYHDTQQGRDLVAAATGDSLFVYEIQKGCGATRLVADGTHEYIRLTFLDSGRLVCMSGERALCMWHGWNLSRHKHADVPQMKITEYVSLTADRALVSGGFDVGDRLLAATRRLPSGAHRVEETLEPSQEDLIIKGASDTLAYASAYVGSEPWIYVLDHRDGFALVDSFVHEPVYGPQRLEIAQGFLVSDTGVHDLSVDPRRPPFLGSITGHVDAVSEFGIRPFPGHPEDLLIANADIDRGQLLLWRASHSEGLTQIWSGNHGARPGYALDLDDTRDLLYWVEWFNSHIHVYDVADPCAPLPLHVEPNSTPSRWNGAMEVLDGIVHVGSMHSTYPGQDAYRVMPFEWTGAALDQVGRVLDTPIPPWGMRVAEDRLVLRSLSAIELQFDPERARSFGAAGKPPRRREAPPAPPSSTATAHGPLE